MPSFPNGRAPMVGSRGAVATSQPLAAQAGLGVLQRGGNAVDAAIACALALTVLEPTSNGIGGDAFALVWDGHRLHGLNASGRAPRALNAEVLLAQGLKAMPRFGWPSVTVPGAPSAWVALHERFGRLPFEDLFAPAIAYAEGGYCVGPVVAQAWQRAFAVYNGARPDHDTGVFDAWFETFAPQGRAPRTLVRVVLPDHARSLRLIAQSGGAAFYDGVLAQALEDFAARTGGFVTRQDLRAHRAEWVEPISTNYRGFDVWEIPPNGQGVAALVALNILEGFDVAALPHGGAESLHVQLEAMKLAFSDAHAFVADPAHVGVPTQALLQKSYAATRRLEIGDSAMLPTHGKPQDHGTVYLCTADADGGMVSYIQSNYAGFGSGLVVPGTGIALQNRGNNFSLLPNHPNRLAPNKRPYHTIIPGFLTCGGQAVGPFGVMGGFMQPQGHVQVVVNSVDYGLNPQAVLDAPRWQWQAQRRVTLEPHGVAALAGLAAKGHDIHIDADVASFGRGQIIWRVGDALVAASDARADGQALVW